MADMPLPDSDTDWKTLVTASRHSNAGLKRADIPAVPGVYAWFKGGECVYVGKAADLRERLSSHRSRSLDLSRSTLRASVAIRELGVTRAYARSRPSRMTSSEIARVNAWFEAAAVAWIVCSTPKGSEALEGRLRKLWMPELNIL